MRKPRKILDRSDNFPPASRDAGRRDFVVPAQIAEVYRRYADMVRVAAPSERLHAFTSAARRLGGHIHPTIFPSVEAADLLWDTAFAYGLVALKDPIIPVENDPVRLDIEPDEQERADGQSPRRTDRSRAKASFVTQTGATPNLMVRAVRTPKEATAMST
jgi:hypothetical protein